MSGRHFNESGYVYFAVEHFAEELESAIENNNDPEEGGGQLSQQVLNILEEQLLIIREAARVMRHIDRLYSGDIGEDTFISAIENNEN